MDVQDDARGADPDAECDRRANQLARRLVAAGVAPGARVGVAVSRSTEMAVAVLALSAPEQFRYPGQIASMMSRLWAEQADIPTVALPRPRLRA